MSSSPNSDPKPILPLPFFTSVADRGKRAAAAEKGQVSKEKGKEKDMEEYRVGDTTPKATQPKSEVEMKDADPSTPTPATEQDEFTPEETAKLLEQSHANRISGNTLFKTSHYLAAIDAYNLALSQVPPSHPTETSILHSNLSACHLALQDYPTAVEEASKALSFRPGWSKPLLRRAKGREGIGGWAALEKALEDYTSLSRGQGEGGVPLETKLSPAERKMVEEGCSRTQRLIEVAKEKETGDMVGKLKDLGNGLLRPFGLSTENFNMVKDEKTGGYSVQFNQGSGKS